MKSAPLALTALLFFTSYHPLRAAEEPLSGVLIQQRADPHILRTSSGHYYFTATVPEYDRVILRFSKTLTGLATADEKVIWRKHDSGAMAAHIWAPEIHEIDGKWYVYFTAGRSDDIWAIRLYVLENSGPDPLTGTWIEKGQLKTNFESFTLDATTFAHDGQRYLVWAQRPLQPRDAGTDIYIAKLKNPWTLDGRQTSISSPTLAWETRGFKVNEAPAVIEHNGRIFIAYSASATDANYCMGLLTANADADLLDAHSWSKSQTPIFSTNASVHLYGPGHNSFTKSEDGKTDILVFHARDYEKINGDPLNDPNRHTRFQPFTWNTDGTPNFATPETPSSPPR